jgi:hypothetical protein
VWSELLGNFGKQRRRPCFVTSPTTCEHRDAPTAGQSTLSAAIPLFGHLIPLLGREIPLFERVAEFSLGPE